MKKASVEYKTFKDTDKSRYELPGGELPFTPKEYGERLAELRKEKGLTLNEVAEKIGRTLQQVQNIEKGKYKSINREYVALFASIYHCSSSYLVGAAKKKLGSWEDEREGRERFFPVITDGPEKAGPPTTLANLMLDNPDMVNMCIKILKLKGKQKNLAKKAMEAVLEMADCQN